MDKITEFHIYLVDRYKKFRDKKYLERLKEIINNYFKDKLYKIIIFGSYIKGNMHPLSDIDIAIILKENIDEEERMKFYKLINKEFGLNPFEFHIISIDQWEEWYKKFIDEYKELN
ncbi:DNA polymerase subunit beta [Nanobdella aerobiophila]|uniref:DNA polymerase subunit beta n=1 Tax=Nanobdella aerobiophila TaxID=2586965 RepID=A0A915SAK6_9ARCH|nr:nucleotidyltransferase domain-containing protein [Nanobdella aerobiophila]BBL45832.1 DNA polymerase subunit beta [Nanobdella aerobiophila]